MIPSSSSFCLSDNSELKYNTYLNDNGLSLRLVLSDSKSTHPVYAHWGITDQQNPDTWITPNKDLQALKHLEWTTNTVIVPGAARTEFIKTEFSGEKELTFQFPGVTIDTPLKELPRTFEFVLFSPPDNWRKHGKSNFSIPIAECLQAVFTEKQFQDAANESVGSRLTKVPKAQIYTERWSIKNNNVIFNLLGFSFSHSPDMATLFFFTDTPHPLLLHWGLNDGSGNWVLADTSKMVTEDVENPDAPKFSSHPWDTKSLQTEFQFQNKSGESPIQFVRINLGAEIVPKSVKFVLKEVHSNNWFKNNNEDFELHISDNPAYQAKKKEYLLAEKRKHEEKEMRKNEKINLWKEALKFFKQGRDERKTKGTVTFKTIILSDNIGELDISAFFNEDSSNVEVLFDACIQEPVILHWGVVGEIGQLRRFGGLEWKCPPPEYRPQLTVVSDPVRSCETQFQISSSPITIKNLQSDKIELLKDFFQTLSIKIPGKPGTRGSELDSGIVPEVGGIACVLREADGNRWFSAADHSDIVIRLTAATMDIWKGALPEVSEDILSAEIGWHHMTLMHRYNLINAAVSQWHGTQTSVDKGQTFMRSWTSIFRPEPLKDVMDAVNRLEIPPAREIEKLIENSEDSTIEDTQQNKEFWSWMFVWGRFSYLGFLDWQRNYNTKPRELAHATECLTMKLSELWVSWKEYRWFIRLVLSTVARGGNQGQAIRDRILDIMHRHKIPEHGANFYEQWHQKLHNNTTPDDIAICSALIQFLKTGGNQSEFWRVLTDHNVTKERLASYERKITSEPYVVHCDIGALIYDLEQYLDILKDVHDSLDLKKAFDYAVRYLNSDIIDIVRRVVNTSTVSGVALKKKPNESDMNFTSSDTAHQRFIAVAEARRQVIFQLTQEHIQPTAARELLFLDFALEQQQGISLQGGKLQFTTYQLTKQITEMITHMSGHEPVNETIHCMAADWVALGENCANNLFGSSVESALMLKALADRVALFVGNQVVELQSLLGPKAEYLGLQVGVDRSQLNIFVDEVVRGSVLFGISVSLKRLEPLLREAAHLPPWQIISTVPTVKGELQKIDRLMKIQDHVFSVPTILLSGAVSGEEELPSGVQAVLVRSAAESPDILSHVSVRARNAHVLLTVCFDPKVVENLEKLVGEWVELNVPVDGSTLHFKKIERPQLIRTLSKEIITSFNRQRTQSELNDISLIGKIKGPLMDLTTMSEEWVISSNQFTRSKVGSKSVNLVTLRPSLPSNIITPQAVAMPFGSFQKVLNDAMNRTIILPALKKCLEDLRIESSNQQANNIFSKARSFVFDLGFPNDLKKEMCQKMEEVKTGHTNSLLSLYNACGDKNIWSAACGVWSSLFTLRPWLSLTKAGRSYHELNMAILIQELLPANYAFVLHSKNPSAPPECQNEMYGEIVAGLGEVLVGNFPGRALSWKMKRQGEPIVLSFPSKNIAQQNSGCLIFRSDSNGEDLEGFAGAGLFESIPTKQNQYLTLTYSTIKLVRDNTYRQSLLKRIGELAFTIEDAFKQPMDIEGVVIGDSEIGIVQARPQV